MCLQSFLCTALVLVKHPISFQFHRTFVPPRREILSVRTFLGRELKNWLRIFKVMSFIIWHFGFLYVYSLWSPFLPWLTYVCREVASFLLHSSHFCYRLFLNSGEAAISKECSQCPTIYISGPVSLHLPSCSFFCPSKEASLTSSFSSIKSLKHLPAAPGS